MKYKAIFEVPATAFVEIIVDEANQTEALAQAYDEVRRAKLSQARLSGLALDLATNVSLERDETSDGNPVVHVPSVASVMASRQDGYRVLLFRDGDYNAQDAVPALTLPVASYVDAHAKFLETVLQRESRYGSGKVVNVMSGRTELEGRNPRGGWEVDAYAEGGTEVKHSETWLDKPAALHAARSYAARPDIARVVITDYNDREAGPKPFRTIE